MPFANLQTLLEFYSPSCLTEKEKSTYNSWGLAGHYQLGLPLSVAHSWPGPPSSAFMFSLNIISQNSSIKQGRCAIQKDQDKTRTHMSEHKQKHEHQTKMTQHSKIWDVCCLAICSFKHASFLLTYLYDFLRYAIIKSSPLPDSIQFRTLEVSRNINVFLIPFFPT